VCTERSGAPYTVISTSSPGPMSSLGASGTMVTQMALYSTASIPPAAVSATSCSDQTFPLKGVMPADRISIMLWRGAKRNVPTGHGRSFHELRVSTHSRLGRLQRMVWDRSKTQLEPAARRLALASPKPEEQYEFRANAREPRFCRADPVTKRVICVRNSLESSQNLRCRKSDSCLRFETNRARIHAKGDGVSSLRLRHRLSEPCCRMQSGI
jgi:hypothetical protein